MERLNTRRTLMTIVTAAVAIALVITGGASANASPVGKYIPERPVAHYLWEVTSVGAAHTTYGSWRTCVTITPRSTTSTATCSAGGTVSNSVTGTLGVGIDGISASVGFNVSQSYTVTGSQSFTIPAHAGGTLQWRPVFSTKTVHQTEYYYPLLGARSVVATATNEASKYTSPTFRYVS